MPIVDFYDLHSARRPPIQTARALRPPERQVADQREGVYEVNCWQLKINEPNCMPACLHAGMPAFRGFDVSRETFGDVAVQASSGIVGSVAAFNLKNSADAVRALFAADN